MLTIGVPIAYNLIMKKISLEKTIRPTNLQPKLYSVINELAKTDDYTVVVNKDNKPLCVIMSYSLAENIDLEGYIKKPSKSLAQQVKDYYKSLPSDEKELLNEAIDDGTF